MFNAKSIGLKCDGCLEPVHTFWDSEADMCQRNKFKAQDWKRCNSHEAKILLTKETISTIGGTVKEVERELCEDCNVTGHHSLWEMLTRRGITWDMIKLCPFPDHAAIQELLMGRLKRPSPDPEKYDKVTIAQCKLADNEIMRYIDRNCRNGVRIGADGTFPIAEAIREAVKPPDVLFHLQPLPKKVIQKRTAEVAPSSPAKKGKSGGKGGTEPSQHRAGKAWSRIPEKNRGKCPQHPEVKKRFCFGYGDGCTGASPGGECPKGLHLFPEWGCFQKHPLHEHRP